MVREDSGARVPAEDPHIPEMRVLFLPGIDDPRVPTDALMELLLVAASIGCTAARRSREGTLFAPQTATLADA